MLHIIVDLWSSLDDVHTSGDVSIPDLMSGWTGQQGFPVVSVTRDGDKLVLTQEKFQANGVKDPSG